MTTGQQWDIVTSVGVTALAVAAARALESHRDDRLMSDPYAAAFVKAADTDVPMPTTPQEIEQLADGERAIWDTMRVDHYMGVRSRFFDDFFAESGRAGIRQAVILAAGLDVRANRLVWPEGTTVFEIDQPKVLEFKQEVLDEQGATAACDRRTVAIDLREDWASALLEAGFDTSKPTAWLAEGLLPYLPPEAQQQLLETIDKLSAPGSRVAVEDFGDLAHAFEDEELVSMGQQWGIDMRDLLHADERPRAGVTLGEFGWSANQRPAEEIAADYGRSLETFPMQGLGGFLTAEKNA